MGWLWYAGAICAVVFFVFNMTAVFFFTWLSGLLITNRPEYINSYFWLPPALAALVIFVRGVERRLLPPGKLFILSDVAIFIIWELTWVISAHAFHMECLPMAAHFIWLAYFALSLAMGQKRWLLRPEKNVMRFLCFVVAFVFAFLFNSRIFFTYSGAGALRKNQVNERVDILLPSKLSGVNSMGLRGPEISVDKPPGVIRVACMGDSSTYGWMVPGHKTYPRLLETLLNISASHHYQVINGGVLGHDSTDGLNRFVEKILPLHPDIVTIYYGVNRDRKHPEKYRESVAGLIRLCRESNIKIALLTYPDARKNEIREINSVIMKLAAETNTPALDIAAYFSSLKHPENYFFDRLHPNAAGHREIAEQLAAFIVKSQTEELLKKKDEPKIPRTGP